MVLEIEKESMVAKIVHTRNVDNVSLVIDKDPLRDKHMDCLCNYLTDASSYSAYMTEIAQTYKRQELKVVDSFVVKRFLKNIIPAFFEHKLSSKLNETEFKRLLKNETRRDLFLRSIIKDN